MLACMASGSMVRPGATSSIASTADPSVSTRRRQGRPFGLPAAQRALVLLRHGRDDGGREHRRAAGGRQDERGADGIALVRHGRGAAAAWTGGLGGLAHFDLHHQRDVARGLGQRADDQGGVLRQGRDAYALGEPGAAAAGRASRRLASDFITGSAFSAQAPYRLPEAPPNWRICVSLKLVREAARGAVDVGAPSPRSSGRAPAASPAAAGCGPASACGDACARGWRRPRRYRRAPSGAAAAPRRAEAPSRCRGRPGWWRPSGRSPRPRRRAWRPPAVSALTTGTVSVAVRRAASTSGAGS